MAQLSRIALRGYKSIETLDLKLRPINVLIGANGAGKSNFIGFFRMLNEVVEGHLGLYVQRSGQANALLYFGRKVTDEIAADLAFYRNGYTFRLAPTDDGRLIFADERIQFAGDLYNTDRSIGHGHAETALPTAFKFDPDGVPKHVIQSMKDWAVYHFHDTSPDASVKQEHSLNDNERLRYDAANLAAYLYLLREAHPANYALIRATVRRVFPRFDDFALRPNPLNPERIRLDWRELGSEAPFGPHQLSDGTLRFMALATLLLQPDMPATVLIDEPELGLHPSALVVLAGLVKSAATRSQLILTTQSVTFLNEFSPEDVIVVNRSAESASGDYLGDAGRVPLTFRRIESSDELNAWLDDYTVGSLWEMNVLGGRP